MEARRLLAHEGLRRLLPRSRQARRGLVRRLPERRHDGPGLHQRKPRRHLHVPAAQYDKIKSTEGVETREYNFWNWDYVGFNCYEGPSGGHPALRDKQFRGALEYAIDREKILANAYSGRGIPGYTFLPPDTWSDPDYAWAPSGDQTRTYDPDRANQILDDAGYPDTNGDGVREYKGKPIKLRLWADQETPEAARACKLIAGWWKAVGIDVAFSVQDQGVYFDSIWATRATRSTPTSMPITGSGTATSTPARPSRASRPRRSRAGTSSPGRTPSTALWTSSRPRRWTPTSAPTTSIRCRRSCTRTPRAS